MGSSHLVIFSTFGKFITKFNVLRCISLSETLFLTGAMGRIPITLKTFSCIVQTAQVRAGDHKSESESLMLRQCDAFTDDVPPFGLFIEQLEIFLVSTSDFGVLIIFYTLSRNSSIFTLYFSA